MKTAEYDPAEEWLAKCWLGNLYSIQSKEETSKKIKVRLFNNIYKLLEKTKQFEPPYNPQLLFKDRKILKKIETKLPNNRAGIIIPTVGGFILKVKYDDNIFRKRFTIAHEIGHTFFYDLTKDIPAQQFIKSKSRYWVQEDYSNEIAGAILLPEPSLKKIIKGKKLSPSLNSLDYICKLYEVSLDVLHRRLIRSLNIWDCLIFKSTMNSGGIITNDSSSVSKGISYKKWNIPKLLNKEESSTNWKIPKVIRDNLYRILSSAFRSKESLKKEELKDNDIIYIFQSNCLNKNNLNLSVSLITKKATSRHSY